MQGSHADRRPQELQQTLEASRPKRAESNPGGARSQDLRRRLPEPDWGRCGLRSWTSRRGIGSQPLLGLTGVSKHAHRAEIGAGLDLEHSHHTEHSIAGGQYGTRPELHLLANGARSRADGPSWLLLGNVSASVTSNKTSRRPEQAGSSLSCWKWSITCANVSGRVQAVRMSRRVVSIL